MGAPDLGSAGFSDAVFGDNDGCPEAGETIEVVITLINTRFEPIDGVEIHLSCEDASIVMDNETASIGTIAARSSADNADPLMFTVPTDYHSRIDSFSIAVTYDGCGYADTLIVTQSVGKPHILLVDDDANDTVEDYYTDCLERILVPYDMFTKPPVPTTGDLAGYDLVVWFTGDFRLPFDATDISAISGHLDTGGSLFLTGQGIAAELDMLDRDFLNNYLKCEYVNSDFTLVLPVAATSQVFQPGDTAVLIGGAGNQTAPDHLAPVNGGVVELDYLGTGNVGAVSYAGDYKLLFFGFGFEAQPNGSDRWLNRDVA